jgi:hypothetical protein
MSYLPIFVLLILSSTNYLVELNIFIISSTPNSVLATEMDRIFPETHSN